MFAPDEKPSNPLAFSVADGMVSISCLRLCSENRLGSSSGGHSTTVMVTWAGRRRRSATISDTLAEGPAYITAILRSTSVMVSALRGALGGAAPDECADTATAAALSPDDAAISALDRTESYLTNRI